MESKTEEKIQEIQILEQNLHNFLLQKQNFQIENAEIQNALEELDISGDEVYKVIGQVMLKTEKGKLLEDLKNREESLNIRIKTLEKQEKELTERIESLREDIMKSIGQ
jgi:prefoldin beta subunit